MLFRNISAKYALNDIRGTNPNQGRHAGPLPNFANPQNIRSTMRIDRIFIYCLV
jgi:hypothetical protein